MSTNPSLPVLIGSRRYSVDLSGFLRRPLASIRQMQDLSREPSDATFDNQGIWKRTQSDFIYGAGQNYLDQEDEADRRRFRASKGIDVWNRRQLTLLPDTTSVDTVGDGSTGDMVVTKDWMYAASGTGIVRSDGSSWVTCTGVSGTIKSLTVIGGYVYASGTASLRRAAVGSSSFAGFGSSAPDVVGTGGGRLIGGEGAVLYEILNDGTTSAIYTHFDAAGFNWTKIIAAPNGIYCFGDDSGRTVAYLLTVVDATGEISAPYPCLQLPDGEFVRDVLFYGGVLALATNLGLRLATINGSGFLTAGPVIEIGDVECLCTDGNDIWFGWTNYDGVSTGLGRMRPERFTDTLVPAYASDLMITAQGAIKACASFEGKRFFLLDAVSGTVYGQSNNKVSTGSFWTGAITYGTPERKAMHSIEAAWDPLPAGASVTLQVLDGIDGAAASGGVVNSTTGSKTERGTLDPVLEDEEVEVKVILTRASDATTAPVLRRWTLRAIPLPYRTEELILPLMLRTQVVHVVGGVGIEVAFDPIEEFNYLHGLMAGRSLVDVTVGERTEMMLVDAIGVGPDVQGVGINNWTPKQDWVEGTWAIRLLTIEPTA